MMLQRAKLIQFIFMMPVIEKFYINGQLNSPRM